jgi:hypothetical protein
LTPPEGEPSPSFAAAARRELLVFAAFAALTVIATWPWAAHLRDAAADEGDPYLNAWTLFWGFHQTFHDPLHLFNGNIFYPYRYSLAFSEHNYGIALPFFPLFALGVRPLTVESLATLLGFAFSGYGAFRLARTLTGSTAAGWVAGIGFAFTPYRFTQISHVNYLSAGWIPILLEALVLYVRGPSRRRAAWLSAAFLMNGLTCIHWLVLPLVPLAVTFVWLLLEVPRERRLAIFAGAGRAVGYASLLLLPFLLPYQRAARLYGFVRNPIETMAFSARPADWLAVDPESGFWRRLGISGGTGEFFLFPGFGMPLLACASLALLLARRRTRAPVDALVVGAVWTLLGFVGSLGMRTPFHRLLYEGLVLFRSIRVPARWAMVSHLGLAILAGAGALVITAAVARTQRARTAIFAVFALAIFAEDLGSKVHQLHGAVDPDEATLYLKRVPMRAGIVQLPAGGPRGNYLYDLRAADHLKPLITAVSGFVTPETRRIQDLTHRDPIPDELMDLLERIPTSYVAVHDAWLDPYERASLAHFLTKFVADERLRFIKRFEKPWRTDLYTVTKTEPESVAEAQVPGSAGSSAEIVFGPGGRREDPSLTGSIDEPAEDDVVKGELLARGWARIPGEDLFVTVLIDGRVRKWRTAARTARPDVGHVLPLLGDCTTAGYQAHFPFQPGDDGRHELLVLLQSSDGRIRHYPIRHFTWRP